MQNPDGLRHPFHQYGETPRIPMRARWCQPLLCVEVLRIADDWLRPIQQKRIRRRRQYYKLLELMISQTIFPI